MFLERYAVPGIVITRGFNFSRGEKIATSIGWAQVIPDAPADMFLH